MRYPTAFYRDLHDLRSKVGNSEYDRDDIRPQVVALLEKHNVTRDDLLNKAADNVLNNVEAAEDAIDPNQGEMFDYGAHVALGEKKRIKRGRMNLDQHRRRKLIIDRNKKAQDAAWAREDDWIQLGIIALEGQPLDTARDQVLTIDNEPVEPIKETEPA